MPHRLGNSRAAGSPWLTWSVILAVIFSAEFLIMRGIPYVLGPDRSPVEEAIVDAVALTAFVAPLMWFLIVLPLKRAAAVRERFLADMFTAIEAERRRLAREVHDGVGQSLSLVISGLRSTAQLPGLEETRRKCDELLTAAQHALAEAKQLSLGLRPSLLDDLGLRPALMQLISDVEKHSALAVQADLGAMVDQRWGDNIETHLFRIVQEGLCNVVKHAQATSAKVSIATDGGDCVVEVSDDGKGISDAELQAAMRNGGHLGIIGIQERSKLLNGTYELHTMEPHGTQLTVRFPLPRAKS